MPVLSSVYQKTYGVRPLPEIPPVSWIIESRPIHSGVARYIANTGGIVVDHFPS